MNFKVTATPNGKGKVKITVYGPEGYSRVLVEKCKEGRFSHAAIVHYTVTQNSVDRYVKRIKRDLPYHMVENCKVGAEKYIGQGDWEIQMATSKENAMKKTANCDWYETVGVEVLEVEAA